MLKLTHGKRLKKLLIFSLIFCYINFVNAALLPNNSDKKQLLEFIPASNSPIAQVSSPSINSPLINLSPSLKISPTTEQAIKKTLADLRERLAIKKGLPTLTWLKIYGHKYALPINYRSFGPCSSIQAAYYTSQSPDTSPKQWQKELDANIKAKKPAALKTKHEAIMNLSDVKAKN